jgi:hypothetical protein
MSSRIAKVGAIVELELERADQPDRLAVNARLFAELVDGTRLRVTRGTMGAGMPRQGVAAIWKRYAGPPLPDDPDQRDRALENYRVARRDVEDAINQLLGRDPEQHRPPRLSWEPLIELLADHSIAVTDGDLIALPFTFEFSDQLLAELDS